MYGGPKLKKTCVNVFRTIELVCVSESFDNFSCRKFLMGHKATVLARLRVCLINDFVLVFGFVL
jgi:hypothetical protein